MNTSVVCEDKNNCCPICNAPPQAYRMVIRAGKVAVCSNCQSWYRIPRSTSEELSAIYQKDYYNSWGSGEQAIRTKRASFVPLLNTLARKISQGKTTVPKCLDVGAATGALLELAQQNGWDVYGVEVNPYAVQILRSRFDADRIAEGDLQAASFERSSFDAITMCDVLEHVLDVKGTLQSAKALLMPGGALCITTPCIDSWSRHLMGKEWLHFKEEHIQYFSAKALRQVLSELGFINIEIRPYWKRLTLDYIHAQLLTYKHPFLSPVIRFIHSVMPASLCRYPFPYLLGEIVVIAEA